jgi:hypothetical protein
LKGNPQDSRGSTPMRLLQALEPSSQEGKARARDSQNDENNLLIVEDSQATNEIARARKKLRVDQRSDESTEQRIRVLVTFKAYPRLSQKFGEVVCVAGVRVDTGVPRWIRLFPVGFRDLLFSDQFHKYQFIEISVKRPPSDVRPESFTPLIDSLIVGETLDTKRQWAKRRELIQPLIVPSMCWLQREQATSGRSLGVFRPLEVFDLTIESIDPAELSRAALEAEAHAAQGRLFGPGRTALEPAGYRFRYQYRCRDSNCRGHDQSFIDWEVIQAARKWQAIYRTEAELIEKLRERFLIQMFSSERDTMFFVGNQHLAPKSFLVLGVFWPPKIESDI